MRALPALIIAFLISLPFSALAQQTPPLPQPRPAGLGAPLDLTDSSNEAEIVEDAAPGDQMDFTDQPSAPAASPLGPDQPVTLSARISEGGPLIPSGLIWRVFGTEADENGQLELVARSETAVAGLSLPPGEYLVHAAYGRSQVSDTLVVVLGPNEKTIVLDAGALKLRSAVSGDISILASQLRFDIFTSGTGDDRVPVVRDVRQDTLIHLNAGVYNVVSRWGDINATVRADLRVEPGQMTEATLFHKAAQISLKLASQSGGEAIADVEWTVKDENGFTVYSASGAFPVAILAEGDYLVLAKLGANVYNREFQVQPGPPREIEVLTEVY